MLLFTLIDYTILGTESLCDLLIFEMGMRVGAVTAEMNAVFPPSTVCRSQCSKRTKPGIKILAICKHAKRMSFIKPQH